MNSTAYHISINKPYMLIMRLFFCISLVFFYVDIQKMRTYQKHTLNLLYMKVMEKKISFKKHAWQYHCVAPYREEIHSFLAAMQVLLAL